jgi:phage-related minor tail protein
LALTVGELTGFADLDTGRFESGLQRVGRGMQDLADDVEREAGQAGEAGGEALGEGLATEAEQGVEKASSRIGTALKGVALAAGAAGLAAGAALVKGVTGAMEQEQVAGKLGAQLGATPELARQYGQIAGKLYAGAVTEDVESAAAAVRATMSSGLVPPGATTAQIEQIATRVHDLADTFELDLGQAANAAGQMIKTGLAKDGAEAIDVMTRGLQVMGPRADDLGDTFNEYSTIFRQLGLSATQATGLLAQGMAAGARDTDVVADSLKELTLITQGGGDAVNEAFAKIGLSGSAMQKAFVQGGPAAAQGLDTLLDRLRAMKDPVERQSVALTLFGTKSEDVQKALYSLDPSSATAALGEVGGAAGRMGDSLRDNASTRIEQFQRGIEQGLTQVVGGTMLPLLERAGGALADRFGPALGQAAQWARNDALPAVTDFARGVASDLVPAVSTGATWLADHLGPAAAAAGRFVRDDLMPAAQTAGRVLRDDVAPAAGVLAVWLGETLVPAIGAVAGFLVDTLIPAVIDTTRWLNDNRTAVAVVAGVIGTLLLPVLITTAVGYAQAGIAATVSAARQVAAWVASGGSAVTNAALSVAASYQTVAGWIASGASAVASGAQQVAAWVATGARAVWGMALQAAAAAEVVAGWVLMGVQSMIRAAQMAAAWVLAMGPVGWITAAVIALVALIIANWDTIKDATVTAWNWIWNWIKQIAGWLVDLFMNFTLVGLLIKHWQSIKDGAVAGWNAVLDFVKQIPGWIYNAFLNFTPIGLLISHWDSIKSTAVQKFGELVAWIKGVPGMIGDALGNLGGLLVSKGRDLITGLMSGVTSMGGWLKDRLTSFAKDMIPGPIASALGIHSPSRVMRDQIGRWIPAGIVEGIEQGSPALDATMRSLVQPPPVPVLAGAASAPAGGGWGGSGGGFHIQNYYESDSGSAAATAEELLWLSKGRG